MKKSRMPHVNRKDFLVFQQVIQKSLNDYIREINHAHQEITSSSKEAL